MAVTEAHTQQQQQHEKKRSIRNDIYCFRQYLHFNFLYGIKLNMNLVWAQIAIKPNEIR